jgi:predicted tellurium resistance membrane protein TerC
LIGKSTYEIHEKLEAAEHSTATKAMATFAAVIAQIVLIDIVFSLDSVITAVGISNHIEIMVIAVVIAAVVMLTFAGSISGFVEKHPTMKVLALSFLILIGSMLVIEGWDHDAAEGLHLKNYAYFAMAFSFLVELINLRVRKHTKDPVQLHNQPSLHQLELATTPVAVGAGAPGVTVATAKPTNAARPRPAGKQRKKR